MTYDLFIAHPSYSSWSLRGWLLFRKFGLTCRQVPVDIYDGGKDRDLAPVAPARTVPVLRLPEGTVIAESLAIAETLHERHPEAGLWPTDPAARATARWLVAEMHAGFTALRSACPMNIRYARAGYPVSEAVAADLQRIETLWQMVLGRHGEGPWLFGDYSVADAFYAPVAMRIAGYSLPAGEAARAYVNAHLADPASLAWRQMGEDWTEVADPYADKPGRILPWPAAI